MMRKDIVKISVATVLLLMLSSLAVADDPSLMTKLFRWIPSYSAAREWLRSSIPVLKLQEGVAKGERHGAKSAESRAKSRQSEVPSPEPNNAPRSQAFLEKRLEAFLQDACAETALLALADPRTVKLVRFYSYPNPFNPDLGADFICKLEGEATLELKIFSMNGSLVRELTWRSSESPPHWDGEDNIGSTVRTGMYVYSLRVTDALSGEVADVIYGKMMAWYRD